MNDKEFILFLKTLRQFREAMSSLTPRETKILEFRLGIKLKKMKTLEEVGREFGVTRERVRQIEARCLEVIEDNIN